jgi:hypothetical protein
VVAFITSLVLTGVLVAIAMWYGSRRPVGKAITWGEAMVASTYVFFILFWAYGMVPHLFLTWADNELEWRPDNFTYEYWSFLGFLKPQSEGGWFPMTITMQAVRDLIVVGIYVAFLGFNIFAWAWWNDRAKRREAKAKELETSDYGRPLVRKA